MHRMIAALLMILFLVPCHTQAETLIFRPSETEGYPFTPGCTGPCVVSLFQEIGLIP